MRNGVLAAIGLSLSIACGSSDKDGGATSEAQKACDDFHGKLSQCGLVSNQPCGSVSTCSLQCGASATCDELKASPPSGSYLDCQAACVGIGKNPFVCANGRQFVDQSGVCDGVPVCSDGSDEANCGTGGAANGGAANGGSSNGGSSNGGSSNGGAANGGSSNGGAATSDSGI